jgi:Uma2 family endonuclease
MTIAAPRPPMNVREFLVWAGAQPQGRYELVDGKIIAMAPELARHNLVKLAVAIALRDAVHAARLPCTVFTDGIGIAVNDHTVREPDASVQCGVSVDLDEMIIKAPVIVVEVASPSSERHDTHAKLIEYFAVPSIRHYLIVLPEKRAVVHHQRSEGGEITTRLAHDGDIALAPPGMTVPVAALFGPPEAGGTETGL